MDVDALTTTKWNTLLKEGKCFRCQKTGHRANDCPDRKGTEKKDDKKEEKKKMGPKELHAHIRTLINDMDKDDQDEFYEVAEKEGF